MEYWARIAHENGRVLIEFPDCPGCQTFATRREDPVAIARGALEGWLELHLEDGEAPPHPRFRGKGHSIAVRVDPMLGIRLQIRWARQGAGLSQGDLANRVGVTRQQISLIEGKGGNLQVSTLQRIAAALNLELEISFREESAGNHAA